VIRPRSKRIHGHDTVARRRRFQRPKRPVASTRLTDAVAASLVVGAFSLCLIVTLTVLSIRACMAAAF